MSTIWIEKPLTNSIVLSFSYCFVCIETHFVYIGRWTEKEKQMKMWQNQTRKFRLEIRLGVGMVWQNRAINLKFMSACYFRLVLFFRRLYPMIGQRGQNTNPVNWFYCDITLNFLYFCSLKVLKPTIVDKIFRKK